MAISVGSVSVDIVPSTRTFAADLKAKLKGLTIEVPVEANTTRLRAELDEAARGRTATITANADTGAARAQLDEVAQNRTSRISANVSGLSQATSGVSGLAVAVAGLGPALIPIVAAVGGLVAVLAAPIAAVAGGLTIGGLIAGAAIKETQTQQKAITELAKKVAAAKLQVAAASTPSGRKSATLREAEAVQAYQAALAKVTPAQNKFLAAQTQLKKSFSGLVASSGTAIFGPVITGMNLLGKILPKLSPLIKDVAGGINTLLSELGKAVSGRGFSAFVAEFGSLARSSIVSFGHIFANVMQGLFFFFRAFAPASKGFLSAFEGLTGSFAKFSANLGRSKGFSSFLTYLSTVGPKVASTLGHLVGALVKVGVVLAPLGGIVLNLVDAFDKFIIAANPHTLVAIAAAIGAVAAAVLIFGSGGTAAVVGLVVGLGGALAYAYTHSTRFRDALASIGNFLKNEFGPPLRDAAKKLLPALASGFNSIKDAVQRNQGLFRVLVDALKLVADIIAKIVIPAVTTLWSKEIPLLGKAIGVILDTIKFLSNALLDMAKFGLTAFKLLVQAALSAFGIIVDGAAAAFGWIPGIGGKVKKAQTAFHEFADNVTGALDAAIKGVQNLQDTLNNVKPPKPIKVPVILGVLNDLPIPLVPGSKPKTPPPSPHSVVRRPTAGPSPRFASNALAPLSQAQESSLGGHSGPLVNVEKVVAQDVNDMLRQLQQRTQLAGLSGRRP